MVVCGDLNGRIGNNQDASGSGIQSRSPIDTVTNQHGKHLLEFLNDSMLCAINGRITPKWDNFTSLRSGKSVVDYMLTKIEDIDNISEQKVHLITDIINESNHIEK